MVLLSLMGSLLLHVGAGSVEDNNDRCRELLALSEEKDESELLLVGRAGPRGRVPN